MLDIEEIEKRANAATPGPLDELYDRLLKMLSDAYAQRQEQLDRLRSKPWSLHRDLQERVIMARHVLETADIEAQRISIAIARAVARAVPASPSIIVKGRMT